MSTVTVPCVHQVPDEDGLWEYADDCGKPVKVILSYDPCYGADADGRRGMGVYFVDDITPSCTCVLTDAEEERIGELAVELA